MMINRRRIINARGAALRKIKPSPSSPQAQSHIMADETTPRSCGILHHARMSSKKISRPLPPYARQEELYAFPHDSRLNPRQASLLHSNFSRDGMKLRAARRLHQDAIVDPYLVRVITNGGSHHAGRATAVRADALYRR